MHKTLCQSVFLESFVKVFISVVPIGSEIYWSVEIFIVKNGIISFGKFCILLKGINIILSFSHQVNE